jgi:type IV pilus assembly protein PilM
MKEITLGRFSALIKDFQANRDLTLLFKKKVDSLVVIQIEPAELRLIYINIAEGNKILDLVTARLNTQDGDSAIKEALQNFIQKNNIQEKNAILCLPANLGFGKRLQLSSVPDKELKEAIRWQLKPDAPFDMTKAVLDYRILKRSLQDDGKTMLDIVCAVIEQDAIRRQCALLKSLGFSCIAVTPEPLGYARLFPVYLNQEDEEPAAILHLGEDYSYLALYKDRELRFYRELPLSLNKMREFLSGTLASEKGQIRLTDEEIEEILFHHGIPLEGVSLYKDKIAASQVLAMILPAIERIAQEIRRSLLYYESQYKEGRPKKILIAGKGANITSLDRLLSKELSLDVSAIALRQQPVLSVNEDPKRLVEDYALFGLSLDYDKGINLLPFEYRLERLEYAQKILLRWLFFIALLVIIVPYLFAISLTDITQKRLDNAHTHLGVLLEFKKTTDNIAALENLAGQIRLQEPTAGLLLKELSNIAPRQLFLTDFSLNYNDKSGSFNGYVKSADLNPDAILTKFISDMTNSGYFKEVNISGLQKSVQEEINTTTFKASFKLP